MRAVCERDLPAGRLEARAHALVRELRAPRRRTRRRALSLAAPVALALAATPALAFHAQLVDLFASGTPVPDRSLGAEDLAMLGHAVGPDGRTVQVASNGQITFYVITDDAGKYCLAPGSSTGPSRFMGVGPCAGSTAALLPSAAKPLVRYDIVEIDPATGSILHGGITGIADDSVARVATHDAKGDELDSTLVGGHAFDFPWPLTGRPVALAALDADGNLLGTAPLS
jgi:hypothetical protein